MSRSRRYIVTASQIMRETGRADFTIQEVVQRSRTSLRSFYQYFANKDELLLAMLEETIADSVAQWREEIAGKDAFAGLRVLVHRIYGSTAGDPWNGLNQALASYHVGIAQQRPDAYFGAFAPLVAVIRELVEQGAEEGVLRSDISPQELTPIVVEMVVGAAVMSSLGGSRFGGASDPDKMWEFCRSGLAGAPDASAPGPGMPPP